jgi:putative membrane protein insertion efficiency factor
VTQVRSAVRLVGAPARFALIALIKGYRASLSGWLGGQCRFFPSCSQYAEEAIRRRGAVRGIALAIWRVGRCNPFGAGGIDPVPGHPSRGQYDTVSHPDHEPRGEGAAA